MYKIQIIIIISIFLVFGSPAFIAYAQSAASTADSQDVSADVNKQNGSNIKIATIQRVKKYKHLRVKEPSDVLVVMRIKGVAEEEAFSAAEPYVTFDDTKRTASLIESSTGGFTIKDISPEEGNAIANMTTKEKKEWALKHDKTVRWKS